MAEVDLLHNPRADDNLLSQSCTGNVTALAVGVLDAVRCRSMGSGGDETQYLCSAVSDTALVPVIERNLPWLLHARLPGVVRMTQRVPALLLASQALETLDISECARVCLTDPLPSQQPILQNLKILKLKALTISDSFLLSVASLCHNIQELDLGRTKGPELTEVGIGAVLCANRNLTHVDLTSCPLMLRASHFQSSLQATCCLQMGPGDLGAPGRPVFFHMLDSLVLTEASLDNEALAVLAKLTGRLRRVHCSFGAGYMPHGGLRMPPPIRSAGGYPPRADEPPAAEEEDAWQTLFLANKETLTHAKAPHLACLASLTAALDSSLTDLDLSDTDQGAPVASEMGGLPWLAACSQLVSLNLARCNIAHFDLEFRKLRALLATLERFGGQDAIVSKLPPAGIPPSAAAFANLQVLRLDWNFELDVNSCAELFSRLANRTLRLRELGLRGSLQQAEPDSDSEDVWDSDEAGSDEEMRESAPKARVFAHLDPAAAFPTLEVLDLAENRLVEADLLRVPALVPRLTSLALGVDRIGGRFEQTDADTTALLRGLEQHCPALQHLALLKMPRTHDDAEALSSLLRARGHQLLSLELSGLGRDDDPFDRRPFAALQHTCPNLQSVKAPNLYWAGYTDSDDEIFSALSRALPLCKVQGISGCKYVAGMEDSFSSSIERASGAMAEERVHMGGDKWLRLRFAAAS